MATASSQTENDHRIWRNGCFGWEKKQKRKEKTTRVDKGTTHLDHRVLIGGDKSQENTGWEHEFESAGIL